MKVLSSPFLYVAEGRIQYLIAYYGTGIVLDLDLYKKEHDTVPIFKGWMDG